jgi:MraZ protein
MISKESISGSQSVLYFHSFYRHGVDDKRRVQIPAKWRPEGAEIEFTLFPWPKGVWREACLLVLPPLERDALIQRLKGMPYSDPKAQALRRLLGAKSAQATVDKAGRMCIPELLAKQVGIDKEAVLVGLLDRFEIWSPERYDVARVIDEELTNEAFGLI